MMVLVFIVLWFEHQETTIPLKDIYAVGEVSVKPSNTCVFGHLPVGSAVNVVVLVTFGEGQMLLFGTAVEGQ